MVTKLSSRQRAISDYELAKNKEKFSIKVLEGRLTVNVARIGTMYPYVKIFVGDKVWKSESSAVGGMNPKWNQSHPFNLSNQQSLDIVAYDKSVIFGETEIGKCTIHLADVLQGHFTEWWDLMTPVKELAGAILVSFDFLKPEVAPTHCSNNSWDLKMHHHVESSPIVSRLRGKMPTQYSHRTPDTKFTHCSTEPDEVCDLEMIRIGLLEENARIKDQEIKVRMYFDKLKEESAIIKEERVELKRSKELLQLKEETILRHKEGIESERSNMGRDKEEIEKLRQSLNSEFLRLKHEKLRLQALRAMQAGNNERLSMRLVKLERQRQRLTKT